MEFRISSRAALVYHIIACLLVVGFIVLIVALFLSGVPVWRLILPCVIGVPNCIILIINAVIVFDYHIKKKKFVARQNDLKSKDHQEK